MNYFPKGLRLHRTHLTEKQAEREVGRMSLRVNALARGQQKRGNTEEIEIPERLKVKGK